MDFNTIKQLAEAGISFVNTENGMSWSEQIGWTDSATTNIKTIENWVSTRWSLVAVPKRGAGMIIDRDDKPKCAAKGFREEWLEPFWSVESPSGGDHHYALQGKGFENLPNIVKVQEVKGAKRGQPGSKLILEIKIHNHTCAAPTVERKGVVGKKDGVYQPKAAFSGLRRIDLDPEFLEWLKQNAENMEPSEASKGTFGRWHKTFSLEDFLDQHDTTEFASGMIHGSFVVVPASCSNPKCGKAARKTTLLGAIAKFWFNGRTWSYWCNACGATRDDLEDEFGIWDGYIYEDDDPEVLTQIFDAEPADRQLPDTQTADHTVPAAMDVGDWHQIACTDVANGKRLAAVCGYEIAYAKDEGYWYVWDGKIWKKDEGNIDVIRKAKQVAKTIFVEASNEEGDKAKQLANWAIKSQSKERLLAMVWAAQSEGTVARSKSDFDAIEHLYTLKNGVVDLRTGELLPHNPRYYMTQMSPFNYLGLGKAHVPQWQSFLDQAIPDKEVQEFIKRGFGYSMFATNREQCIIYLFGTGNDGKGVLLGIKNKVMGGYSSPAEYKTFASMGKVSRGFGGHSDDIAGLAGKRDVYVDETDAGGRLNEGLIKTLTGGGKQKASFKGKSGFEFQPQFTMWWASNFKPRLTDVGRSMRRRIRMVHMNLGLPEDKVDKMLEKRLIEQEGDAIATWMVEGAVEWYKHGLNPPKAVKEWTEQYFHDEDVVGMWIEECVTQGPQYQSPAKETYASMCRYCDENGYFKPDMKTFKKQMEAKGFTQKPTKFANVWLGLKVERFFFDEEPKISVDAVGSLM